MPSGVKRWEACFKLASLETAREADAILHEWLLEECTTNGDEIMCILWMDQMTRKLNQQEALVTEEKRIISEICAMDLNLNTYSIIIGVGESISRLCDAKSRRL